MGTFQEDMDKRLRRLCNVTDDSLRVTQDSKTIYGGYCESCWYEDEVIEVVVYNEDGSELASTQYYDLGDLMRELDEVEL